MLTTEQILENWNRIRDRVDGAARRTGRRAEDVAVMAVTKTQPVELVRRVLQAGIRLLGENRVQEIEEKYIRDQDDSARVNLSGADVPVVHLIGHLQSNKARRAAGLVDCVQSIDKLSTARKLAGAATEQGRPVEVYLEANTSGEESKSGYTDFGRLLEDLAAIQELEGVRARGLMTIGPMTSDATRVGRAFASLRQLWERARAVSPEIEVLSMGMSGDYETAIAEGSTMIRIGTALVGERTYG